jgi:N-acetylglucosaminyldiphosphoundecaprenol N-acetyl-beta-D-mannosaminyltransferase
VLGVGVHALDLPSAVEILTAAASRPGASYVCVTGVHGIMESLSDPEFKRALDGALLVTPDGMPTVWVGRAQGHRGIERVYGPDLMLALCEHSLATNQSHFLFGAGEGVAPLLAERLTARFPGLRVAGVETPPFRSLTDAELQSLADRISSSGADFVWIGLSTPKQERLMARLAPLLDRGVLLGVGAAFDMHAGLVRQAPRWVQRSGLEWAFRIVQEPRRLAGRYLRNNPRFLVQILLQLAGVRVRKLVPHTSDAAHRTSMT